MFKNYNYIMLKMLKFTYFNDCKENVELEFNIISLYKKT